MIQRRRNGFQGAWHQISVYRYEKKGMSKGEFISVAHVNGVPEMKWMSLLKGKLLRR